MKMKEMHRVCLSYCKWGWLTQYRKKIVKIIIFLNKIGDKSPEFIAITIISGNTARSGLTIYALKVKQFLLVMQYRLQYRPI